MKVLVAGSWRDLDDSEYSVLFDSVSVSATIIQPGVLRCYAPRTSIKHCFICGCSECVKLFLTRVFLTISTALF